MSRVSGKFHTNADGELVTSGFVVEPAGIEGTTVRGWLMLPSGATTPLVMLETEDRDSRNRHALLPDLAHELAEILTMLTRMRNGALRSSADSAHPGWCEEEEGVDAPHRSRELTAGVPLNDDTVSARLALGRHHDTDQPSTFIEIKSCDRTFEWAPITQAQHDALRGQLTMILGRPRFLTDVAA
jgi:hypothetical protein